MRRVWKPVAALAVTSLLFVVTGASPMPAGARATTRATIFRAFNSAGAPTIPVRSKAGYCFSGSDAIIRRDAWRCAVGNLLYDPCFSSTKSGGVVVCPNLQLNGGIEIRLTRVLPRQFTDSGSPSLADHPWNIQLANGRHCVFATGATSVIHGIRLNYACGGGARVGLWGLPNRHVQPWTIWSAPFTATSLSRRLAIRHAWM